MSTSGSTGSPRLVRLSWTTCAATPGRSRTTSPIRPTDRAVTSLPLHYCYGLSVVHSHLLAGASVVLTDLSVADPCFWDLAGGPGRPPSPASRTPSSCSSGSASPRWTCRPSHRDRRPAARSTRAGRRPRRSSGRAGGWDLFVMYGQTEATARMAYLPPDLAAEHPGTVGVPVAGRPRRPRRRGGRLLRPERHARLRRAARATSRSDARSTGCTPATSAAGPRPGCSRSPVGRSRIAKVLGHRVDLDHVERGLRAEGRDVRCVDGATTSWSGWRQRRRGGGRGGCRAPGSRLGRRDAARPASRPRRRVAPACPRGASGCSAR